MNRDIKIWSVSDITRAIKELLEESFYPIWLTGEIGDLTIHRSGHVYFTLKDAKSQIRCVFFSGAGAARSMDLREGVEVELFGTLMVYEPRGNYQFNVKDLRAKGIGLLQQQFEMLKKRLFEEGLFADSRKKRIPTLPSCIGVVTSPDGAALRDFLNVIDRRFATMHVRIYPAAVQGAGSAGEIIAGIEYFNCTLSCDVIVLTRGGGSLEDLWSFNEEAVARAVAASRIPVISAIGHEVDFTICDFVADLRVPTPSAAAELVVGRKSELLDRLAHLQRRLTHTMTLTLGSARARLERAVHHYIFREPINLVRIYQQRIDELGIRLHNAVRVNLDTRRSRIQLLDAQLRAFNPRQVLNRGYAILLTRKERIPVTHIREATTGDRLVGVLVDGEIGLTVTVHPL